MKEHIRESAAEYTVGASVVLFCLSPNDASRIIELWGTWQHSTLLNALELLAACEDLIDIPEASLFKLLSDHAIGTIAGTVVGARTWLMSEVKARSPTRTHLEAVIAMASVAYQLLFPSGPRVDYGWITVSELSEQRSPTPEEIYQAQELLNNSCGGYFEFLARIVVFAGTRNKATYLAVLESVRIAPAALLHCNLVINGWSIFSIPDDMLEASISHVQKLTDPEFIAAITSGDFGLWTAPRAIGAMTWHPDQKGSTEQLHELLRRNTFAALHVCIEHKDAIKEVSNVDREWLVKIFQDNVDSFVIQPATWNRLKRVMGDTFTDKLYLRAASWEFKIFSGGEYDTDEEALELPRSVDLLCPIAGELAGRLWRHSERWGAAVHYVKAVKSAISAAARWIRRVDELDHVLRSEARPDVKISACIIGTVHPEGGSEFIERNMREILDAAVLCSAQGRLGLVWAIDGINGLTDATGQHLVNSLVEIDRFAGWEHHADIWFSRSLGTVAHSGKIARWLKSDKNPEWLIPVSKGVLAKNNTNQL